MEETGGILSEREVREERFGPMLVKSSSMSSGNKKTSMDCRRRACVRRPSLQTLRGDGEKMDIGADFERRRNSCAKRGSVRSMHCHRRGELKEMARH